MVAESRACANPKTEQEDVGHRPILQRVAPAKDAPQPGQPRLAVDEQQDGRQEGAAYQRQDDGKQTDGDRERRPILSPHQRRTRNEIALPRRLQHRRGQERKQVGRNQQQEGGCRQRQGNRQAAPRPALQRAVAVAAAENVVFGIRRSPLDGAAVPAAQNGRGQAKTALVNWAANVSAPRRGDGFQRHSHNAEEGKKFPRAAPHAPRVVRCSGRF